MCLHLLYFLSLIDTSRAVPWLRILALLRHSLSLDLVSHLSNYAHSDILAKSHSGTWHKNDEDLSIRRLACLLQIRPKQWSTYVKMIHQMHISGRIVSLKYVTIWLIWTLLKKFEASRDPARMGKANRCYPSNLGKTVSHRAWLRLLTTRQMVKRLCYKFFINVKCFLLKNYT